MKRTIGTEERRARLGRRHHLARPASTAERVATDLVGLHSSDPATVFLSARARTSGFVPEHLEAALYERRSLVRVLGMRMTLFVVPRDLAGVLNEACTRAIAPGQHRRLVQMLAEQGVSEDPAAWLDDVGKRTLKALGRRGEAAAAELTKEVPELATRLSFGEGKTWASTVGVSTRVLFLLAAEGKAIRARPRGAWTSGQYRWAAMEHWLGGPLERPSHPDACAELLSRYLRAFGPASMTDIRWWTGWSAALVKRTLVAVEATEVGLEPSGATGSVLPGDTRAVRAIRRWVALLPSLDVTVMGWKEREWYMGPHAAALFDRNGNAGPTVWVDGRVVGGWAQAGDGEVLVRLLESVGGPAEAAIDQERERLRRWLGAVRIKPRFPTPLGGGSA